MVYAKDAGRADGLNPFDHGDACTTAMRTDALKQELDCGGYGIVFGGARRDEERSLPRNSTSRFATSIMAGIRASSVPSSDGS